MRPRTLRPARALLAVAGLGGLLMTTAPAAAAPFVDVEYDLGDSSASARVLAINLVTESPPHGTVNGTQTLRFASDSASGLATGPVELRNFNLYVHATVGTSVYTAGGGKTFVTLNTSDLHFEFLGLTPDALAAGGAGSRLAGGTVTPLGASGYFRLTGELHCFRVCTPIPGAVVSSRVTLKPQTFQAPLPSLTGATGQPHTVYGTATGVYFDVNAGGGGVPVGVTGTTFIVGREVARTPVPEAGTLPLLAGGLASLGLAARAWRRRARA